MADNNAPDKQVNNTEIARDENGRWMPGVSGNPAGRPLKGHSLTETFKEMLDERPEFKKAIVGKVVELAAKGDMIAIKLLWNYLDGNPRQPVELGLSDINDVLDKLETNYEELGQKAREQVVAPESPIQNQE